jgi:hypothetical protein
MPCPLVVMKCERSGFTGRINEIPYVAEEVPLTLAREGQFRAVVIVRTFPCLRRFKKRPEGPAPTPWWASAPPRMDWEGAWGSVDAALAWAAKAPVERTDANPNGNPPVTCVHCRQEVPWPDRESCDRCGGFTCLTCTTMFACVPT